MESTFSKHEEVKIDSDSILKAIEILTPPKDTDVHRISYNGNLKKFLKMCGIERTTENSSMSMIYGLPVYKNKAVPKGEIWMQDKSGKVIQKFSLPI